MSNYLPTQANLLKVSAVAIAIPRYAGAFALSAGFVAAGQVHTYLGIAEVIAGVSMAVLEGFALAFILNKWRLLAAKSIGWYSLLTVTCLLALSLPLVAIPYLYFMQAGFKAVSDVFPSVLLQNGWNFIVAGVPMLVVIGVGLADVNELEREEKRVDFELQSSRKRAMLEMELSKLSLTVEQAKTANELEIRKLRAGYKVNASAVEAKSQQAIIMPFLCEHCGTGFESNRQLAGHKAHCKASTNGKIELVEQMTR